jgi:hypothetical protein
MSKIEQTIASSLPTIAGIRLLSAPEPAMCVFIGENELAGIPPPMFNGVFFAFKETNPCGYKGFGF